MPTQRFSYAFNIFVNKTFICSYVKYMRMRRLICGISSKYLFVMKPFKQINSYYYDIIIITLFEWSLSVVNISFDYRHLRHQWGDIRCWRKYGLIMVWWVLQKNNSVVILATSLFLDNSYTMSVHICVSYDVLWYLLGCVFSCRR